MGFAVKIELMREKIKAYYAATKPRVTYANALTALTGYLFAVGLFGGFDILDFVALSIGMTLIIASACVLNNLLDRDIDSKMKRTETRPTVTGIVTVRGALMLTAALGVIGFALLAYTGLAVLLLGAFGYLTYVLFYGVLAKRLSIHGTLVGAVSGAVPIVAGYVAISGQIDVAAAILFLILFFWQEPEFYSISIFRRREYKEAGVPVISVVRGSENTAQQIFVYLLLYVASTLALTAFGYTNWLYFVIMALAGAYWIWLAAQGLNGKDLEKWARRMFHAGMLNMLLICIVLPLGSLL